MFSSGSSDLPQSSLQIKQDDKFFCRLLSKESSRANPSLRVYYGGASGAVPFMWESQPGTPKHAFSDTALPPLTPPPAYRCTNSNNKPMINNHSRSNLLRALFLKISPKKSTNVSPYPSPSSSDSSKYHGIRRRCFSQSSSSFDSREDDEGDRTVGSPTSTLCFGTAGRVAWGSRGRRGCYQF